MVPGRVTFLSGGTRVPVTYVSNNEINLDINLQINTITLIYMCYLELLICECLKSISLLFYLKKKLIWITILFPLFSLHMHMFCSNSVVIVIEKHFLILGRISLLFFLEKRSSFVSFNWYRLIKQKKNKKWR